MKVILNSQTTLRIWDCLFYEGTKIIFRVALTLIKRNKSNLLACQDFTTLAECFKEITKDSIVLRCHEFMQVCSCMCSSYQIEKNIRYLRKYFSVLQSIFKVPGSLPGNTIAKLRTKHMQQRIKRKQDKLER